MRPAHVWLSVHVPNYLHSPTSSAGWKSRSSNKIDITRDPIPLKNFPRRRPLHRLPYGLDDWGLVRARDRDVPLCHSVQTALGPTHSLIQTLTGTVSPRNKAVGTWNWSLCSILSHIKNAWSYISTPPHVFLAWYVHRLKHNVVTCTICVIWWLIFVFLYEGIF